jgi:hypothetical protein
VKVECRGRIERNFIWVGGRKNINLLEGSRASAAPASDKGGMLSRGLELWKVVTRDRGLGISILWINEELHNLERYCSGLCGGGARFWSFKTRGMQEKRKVATYNLESFQNFPQGRVFRINTFDSSTSIAQPARPRSCLFAYFPCKDRGK